MAVRRYGLAIPFPLFIGDVFLKAGLTGSETSLKRSKEIIPTLIAGKVVFLLLDH